MILVLKTLLQVQTNVNKKLKREEEIRRIVIAAIYNKNFLYILK